MSSMFVWGACFGVFFRMGAVRLGHQPFTTSSFFPLFLSLNSFLKGPWGYLKNSLFFGVLCSYIVKIHEKILFFLIFFKQGMVSKK